EQPPDGEAIAPAPDRKRGERRAEQRRRADEPDLELAHAECQQVGGQHDGDEAVGERAQGPAEKNAVDQHQRLKVLPACSMTARRYTEIAAAMQTSGVSRRATSARDRSSASLTASTATPHRPPSR